MNGSVACSRIKLMKIRFLQLVLLSAIISACPQQPPQPPPNFDIRPLNTAAPNLQVPAQASVEFIARTESGSTANVTWSVKQGAAYGSIDPQGRFTAPNAVPTPAQATIIGSISSTTRSYVITIVPAGISGIRGTIDIPAGLLGDAARATPQSARTFKADWNAPRVKGELLVIPAVNARPQSLMTTSSLRQARVKVDGDTLRVQVPANASDQAFAERIARETGATVQPNYIYRANAIPNDASYSQQTNLPQIGAPTAWDVQTLVNDNLIAILDTGLEKTLPEIQGRYTEGRDFCPTLKNPNQNNAACDGEDADISDIPTNQGGNGHGTFIAGQIAAVTNNNAGMAGLAHSGKVLIVKIFAADNLGPLADSPSLAKGINYAVAQGARVLNLSLGVCSQFAAEFEAPDQLVSKAIQAARAVGAVVIAAAGNNGNGACGTDYSVQFPGNHPDVVAVGSVDANNSKSNFSAVGPQVSLVAPGNNILSLNQTGTLETKAGTSFAAPQVAAVTGLILTKYPQLQSNDRNTFGIVKTVLEGTAQDLDAPGKDDLYGAGLLRADVALTRALDFANVVQVFAYPLKSGGNPNTDTDYDTTTARVATIKIPRTSGTLNFALETALDGANLKPGTYKILACADLNESNPPCGAGDLGGSVKNLPYEFVLDGVSVTLSRI